MAVDESSSQDSTLIDDDLVAALGFEPVTTIESPTGGDAPTGDAGHANGDQAGGDATTSEADTSSVIDDRPSFFDLGSDDDASVGEHEIGERESGERESGDVESLSDSPDVAAVDGSTAVGLMDADVEGSDDRAIDSVPSIVDTELDRDATAPVGLIDLDADQMPEADHVLDVDPVEVGAVDAEAPELGTEEAAAVIDLDAVDLDADVRDFDAAEVHELADADSVFADATPVLDRPVFDHHATETVPQVDSGLLDLEVSDELAGTAAVATAAPANERRRRLRARKSRRVIRHIDPWSVLTFSVLFHMVVFAALLLSSVLVWNAAIASGMVENVESFIQELGDYETFQINADVMFRAAIVIAGMLTLASSVLVVLLTVVFNLISDLVGGIRVTVIEEETVRVPIDKKRSKA